MHFINSFNENDHCYVKILFTCELKFGNHTRIHPTGSQLVYFV